MTTPRERAEALYAKSKEVAAADPVTAYRLLASAVYEDPTYAHGWFEFGQSCARQGLLPAAISAYRRVLELVPDNVHALNRLGHTLYWIGRVEEARPTIERVIELDPENAHGWCNISMVQSIDGLTADSLESAKKAVEFDKEADVAIKVQLAFAYLYAGQWAKGLDLFRARFPYAMQRYAHMPYPNWTGEDIKGKRLYVLQEMGLGDALSFLRFVPLAATYAGDVLVEVRPELVRLVSHMFRGYTNVNVGPLTQEFPSADYWCSLGDLPTALHMFDEEIERTKTPSIPYSSLAADVAWKVPDRKFHIGICWAGNPENMIDKWRSTTIQQFLELYQVPGVQLYSLQVGGRANDLYSAGCVGLVRDLAPYVRDVWDTTAIVRDLDLVITVESALRHICGVLGTDCWVPLALNGGDWRCGRAGDHPLWDPNTRLWRQGDDATWQPVFERMIAALMELV